MRLAAFRRGLLLLTGLLLPAAGRLDAQEDAALLTGRVTDSATGQPIEAATVLLRGTMLRATTGARGEFRLFPVPSGPQTLTVAAIGYRTGQVAVRVVPAGQTEVAVALATATIELPGIVVTASRGEEEQGESPASVSVVGSRELAQRNVTTIDEVLPFVPGVTFNNSDVAIRGSTGIANGVGSRVLLLLDGHPVLTGDGGEIDFEAIPLLDVERVEVVKGAYSALYGSNALGGVVNLITSPVSERQETVIRAHLGVWQVPGRYRFTDERLTAQGIGLQHSRQLGGVGVRVYAARETTDGFTDNDASRRWMFRTKLASRPGAAHPWDGYAMLVREVDYSFFTWRAADRPFEVDTASRGDNERTWKFLSGFSVTPLVRSRTLLRVSPYLNYNSLTNDFRANADYHRALKAGATLQLAVTAGEGQVATLGADGAFTRVTSNFLGGRDLEDAGLFGQYDVRLAPRLKLVAGGRLDYHRATGGEGEATLSPKLGLTWRAAEQLHLRTSVGRGYRAPSAIEQFVNTTQFGFRVVPNPGLKGERAWTGELGVTGTRGRLWFDASVFQSEYRRLIAPGPSGQLFVFQFQNIERARVRGLDAGVRVRVLANLLDLQASYLLLGTEDLARGTELPYRSRHTVTGTADLLGGLAGIDVRYRSRPEEVLVYPLDPRKDIVVVDLRLGYRVLGTGLQLKVGNLFQHEYTNVQERTPGPPRSISLTAFRGF